MERQSTTRRAEHGSSSGSDGRARFPLEPDTDRSPVASDGFTAYSRTVYRLTIVSIAFLALLACKDAATQKVEEPTDMATAVETTKVEPPAVAGKTAPTPAADPAEKSAAKAERPASSFGLDAQAVGVTHTCVPERSGGQYCEFHVQAPVFIAEDGSGYLRFIEGDCDACGGSVYIAVVPKVDERRREFFEMSQVTKGVPRPKGGQWTQADFDRIASAVRAHIATLRYPVAFRPGAKAGSVERKQAKKAAWTQLTQAFPTPKPDCEGALSRVELFRGAGKLAARLTYLTAKARLSSDVCSTEESQVHLLGSDDQRAGLLMRVVGQTP